MVEPLEDSYFSWLCAKVLPVDVPRNNNYQDLLHILHTTEFEWSIVGDRNRAEDGRELREDFLRESYLGYNPDWFNEPVSVLEVLLAFASRAWFQTDTPVRDWFWQFIANLELDEYRRVTRDDAIDVEERLNAFMWRTYRENGQGGMFPLRWPKHDQRDIEIWYQFCEYLEDQGLV